MATTILLDSQALLWVLADDERIGPRTRARIAEAAAVHVSAASIWELTIKAMLGRVRIPADLDVAVQTEGMNLLDVKAAHAQRLHAFPELVRHDPFDRLIIAQAEVEQMVLITGDRVLLGLRDFVVNVRD